MKLSILIPHLKHRNVEPLVTKLAAQATPEVEIELLSDDGQMTSGTKRNKLMHKTTGEYVTFVDDDDDVADDYIPSLLQAIESKPDVITFNLKYVAPSHTEVWRFGLCRNNRPHGLMCINHLCAWRRELATKVMWCPHLGFKDDHVWFEPLVHSGLVKTVVGLNKVLYIYQYHPQGTCQQTTSRKEFTKQYIGPGLMCFIDRQKNLYIQCQRDPILVRDKYNRVIPLREDMQFYHTVK